MTLLINLQALVICIQTLTIDLHRNSSLTLVIVIHSLVTDVQTLMMAIQTLVRQTLTLVIQCCYRES